MQIKIINIIFNKLNMCLGVGLGGLNPSSTSAILQITLAQTKCHLTWYSYPIQIFWVNTSLCILSFPSASEVKESQLKQSKIILSVI